MREPTADWATALTTPSTGFAPGRLVWEICPFDALSVHRLQAINAARQQVFVIEQCCPYLDADGRDGHAHHLSAWGDAPVPLAYARILAPGVAYDGQASIGRVLTTMPSRGTGLGHELVRRAIALSRQLYPGVGIRISAQSRLERFYQGHGFASRGDGYLEDDIPHIAMELAADND